MHLARILLVDDEEGILITIGELFRREGYDVETSSSLLEATSLVKSLHFDLALIDLRLGDDSGIELLRQIKSVSPSTQVAVFTGSPDIPTAVEAVKLGAVDYITKPMRFETILAVARHALHAKKISEEKEKYRSNLDAILSSVPDGIIMVDDSGSLQHFNESARALCGYSQSDIGVYAASLGKGCNGNCRHLLLDVLKDGKGRTLKRISCRAEGGAVRTVTVTANPVLNEERKLRGAVAVIRDESELVEMERVSGMRQSFHSMTGCSEGMRKVYNLVEALQDMPTTVLITGETGTGKELVANALHYGGFRREKPFVAINCAALSETILESEIFGHVKGAFTGAVSDKIGRFELADGGTLFLDEIGDTPLSFQSRLLRFLQEGTFEKVGSSRTSRVDVRVITATNRNLLKKVKDGSFREDLYYRLNVIKINLPPLKERRGDIALLADHFIEKFNKVFNRSVCGISQDALKLLENCEWKGNVRELEHAIEHAFVLCKGDRLEAAHIPEELSDSVISEKVGSKSGLSIDEAIRLSNGNKSKAADMLGISRRTIYRRI